MIAELQIQFGHLDDAEDSLTRAVNIARSNEELFYLAELQRLKGLLHRAQGKEQAAREALGEALETARSQGATGWEKRILETMEQA